jgi:hypothetical protein
MKNAQPFASMRGKASMKQSRGLPFVPTGPKQRDFLVEVYGTLFGAIGRLTLPWPVRLSDFVNDREGFLRLTDLEFMRNLDLTMAPAASRKTEYLINKSGIELICRPPDTAIERRAESEPEQGISLWQAFSKMAGNPATDLRVAKEPYLVEVHTHRFIVRAQLHLAHGAAPEAMLSNLPNKFVPVTNATARFISQRKGTARKGASKPPAVIERELMLVNREHILLVELDDGQRGRAAA